MNESVLLHSDGFLVGYQYEREDDEPESEKSGKREEREDERGEKSIQ